jgi:hypothetical protein
MAKKPSAGSSDSKDPTIPYEVGYGRPPIESRFQPGQSGNPKGRQKRKRNLRTEVREALDKSIALREGDRTRKVTKQAALITTLVNSALKGDQKACSSLLSIMRAVGLADEAPDANSHQPLTAEDDALVEDFLRRNSPNGSDEPSDGGES